MSLQNGHERSGGDSANRSAGAESAEGLSLVLDVGTGAVKAALLAPDGTRIDEASAPLRTRIAAGGVMEQDAGDWESAAVACLRALSERDGPTRAARVVLTGQMQNLTLTDASGTPLRPTLLYGDTRAVREAEDLVVAVPAERLRQLTANEPDAAGLPAKVRWLARHERRAWQRAERVFLGAADLLAFRLTGQAACDTTTASTTGLMDHDRRAFLPEELLAEAGLAFLPPLLPDLVPGGARVGWVEEEAAARWGLPSGLPVHVGPGDAGATTVGAGSGEPGHPSAYVGTSGWVALSADRRGDVEAGVFTLAHPAPGRSIQIAPLLTAGGNLAWAREALGWDGPYEDLIAAALARPPGRLLYLPYLQGERSPIRDPFARGAFVGMDMATTDLDLVRAVLEGVAFAYRHALEALTSTEDRHSAFTSWPLVLSGGGTRTDAWCRLFATVLNVPVRRLEEPDLVAVRGAWRCARAADGAATGHALPVHGPTFEPDRARGLRYDDLYERFREAYVALAPTFRGLAEVRLPTS